MRSLLGAGVLLTRKRDAGGVRAGDLGEVEGKSAPAAPDIEHVGAGLDQKLGRQVAFLGELGVVE